MMAKLKPPNEVLDALNDGKCIMVDGEIYRCDGTRKFRWNGKGWAHVEYLPMEAIWNSEIVSNPELP